MIEFIGSLQCMLRSAKILLFALLWGLYGCHEPQNTDVSLTKIALRAAANEILIASGDTTSVIQPIKQATNQSYLVEFESPFKLNPDSLVHILHRNIQKAGLSIEYQMEVLNCSENEVAFSFQRSANQYQTFIPCSGREMAMNCYLFKFKYIEQAPSDSSAYLWLFIWLAFGLTIMAAVIKRKKQKLSQPSTDQPLRIGQYQFHQMSHQLIFDEDIISLSKKEVELLMLLYRHQNEVVKREFLVKKVWEEQGVVVGRSLDTYISKLRKKLSKDQGIKITNLHGVGYKLEINTPSS